MELESVSTEIIEGAHYTHELDVRRDIEPKKILIPVVFSENSCRAVDYVAAFAAETGAEVTLFHVWRRLKVRPGDKELEEFVDQMERDIQIKLETYRKRLKKAGVDPARISTKYTKQGRSRASAIVNEAEKGDYDTIVMGRRELSELHEGPLGQVVSTVLELAVGFAIWLIP